MERRKSIGTTLSQGIITTYATQAFPDSMEKKSFSGDIKYFALWSSES